MRADAGNIAKSTVDVLEEVFGRAARPIFNHSFWISGETSGWHLLRLANAHLYNSVSIAENFVALKQIGGKDPKLLESAWMVDDAMNIPRRDTGLLERQRTFCVGTYVDLAGRRIISTIQLGPSVFGNELVGMFNTDVHDVRKGMVIGAYHRVSAPQTGVDSQHGFWRRGQAETCITGCHGRV